MVFTFVGMVWSSEYAYFQIHVCVMNGSLKNKHSPKQMWSCTKRYSFKVSSNMNFSLINSLYNYVTDASLWTHLTAFFFLYALLKLSFSLNTKLKKSIEHYTIIMLWDTEWGFIEITLRKAFCVDNVSDVSDNSV